MKKYLISLVLLSLLAPLLVAQEAEGAPADSVFQASDFVVGMNAFNEQLIDALDLQPTVRVIVLPLPDFQGNYTLLSKFIREQLITALSATRGYILVEDTELLALAKKAGVAPMDLGKTPEFGELIDEYANEVIIAGAYTDLGDKIAVMARVVLGVSGDYGGGATVYVRKGQETARLLGEAYQPPLKKRVKGPELDSIREQAVAEQDALAKKALDSMKYNSKKMVNEESGAGEANPVPTEEPKPEMPKEKPGATKTDTGALDDSTIYRIGREHFIKKDFVQAHGYFEQLIRKFPESELADNAGYWAGECLYGQAKWQEAANRWQKVLDDYPYGNKVPDCTLKRGYAEERLGRLSSAITTMEEVIRRFEDSSQADRARSKLQELRARQQ